MPEQATNGIEETPICGICGDLMVEYKKGQYKCEICEFFFGGSSRINTCSRCKSKFGRYKVVEERFLSIFPLTEEGRRELNHRLCPKCREQSPYFNEIRETLAEKIKYELEQENVTIYQLATLISDLTPKNVEFICYCSGDVRDNDLKKLLRSKLPKIRESIEVVCAYCGKTIMLRDPYWYECPEGEDWETSAKCKYYHAYPPPHFLSCYRKKSEENE